MEPIYSPPSSAPLLSAIAKRYPDWQKPKETRETHHQLSNGRSVRVLNFINLHLSIEKVAQGLKINVSVPEEKKLVFQATETEEPNFIIVFSYVRTTHQRYPFLPENVTAEHTVKVFVASNRAQEFDFTLRHKGFFNDPQEAKATTTKGAPFFLPLATIELEKAILDYPVTTLRKFADKSVLILVFAKLNPLASKAWRRDPEGCWEELAPLGYLHRNTYCVFQFNHSLEYTFNFDDIGSKDFPITPETLEELGIKCPSAPLIDQLVRK